MVQLTQYERLPLPALSLGAAPEFKSADLTKLKLVTLMGLLFKYQHLEFCLLTQGKIVIDKSLLKCC